MKRLLYGCLVCLVAMVIPPLIMVILFSHSLPIARGMMPGKMELKLEDSKKYAIWNDYICNYDGKEYKLEKNLSTDWKFQLIAPNDEKLDIDIPKQKTDNAGKQMSSLKEAEFKTAGKGIYVLTAVGSSEKRPFSVRPDIGATVKKILLPVFIGSIIFGLVGFISVMWGSYDLIMTYSRDRKEKSA